MHSAVWLRAAKGAVATAAAVLVGLGVAPAAHAQGGVEYIAPNAQYYAYEGPVVPPNGGKRYAPGRRGWDLNVSTYYGGGRFTMCSRFDPIYYNVLTETAYSCATVPATTFIWNGTYNQRKYAYVQNYDNSYHTMPSMALDFGTDFGSGFADANTGVPPELTQRDFYTPGLSRLDKAGLSCASFVQSAELGGGGFCTPTALIGVTGSVGLVDVTGKSIALAIAPAGATDALLTDGDSRRRAQLTRGLVAFQGISTDTATISFDGGLTSVPVPTDKR